MKIAVFNHSFFYLSETFIYRQLAGIPKNTEAVLISPDFQNEDLFPTPNRKVLLKPGPALIKKAADRLLPTSLINSFRFFVPAYLNIEKTLQQEKPDALHVHFGFNGIDIFPTAKKLNIPLIVSFHGVDASPQMVNRPNYKKRVQEMIKYASAVIICSAHMRGTLGLTGQEHKTFLVPYGVDTIDFTGPGSRPRKSQVNILHSGRLVAKKGVPDLIRTFRILSEKFDNIKLTIIGNGQELEESRKIAEAVKPQTIEFIGAQPQEKVKKYMAEADIFVLNSRTSDSGDMEGLPNAILEAMSMGLPVVSTYHAGIPEIITDGANGILVKEKDNAGLAAALTKLITSEELRNNMGREARLTIENKFTGEKMNEKIAKVYEAVMLSRQTPTSVSSVSAF